MVFCVYCGKLLPEPIPINCPYCGKENIASTTVKTEVSQIQPKIIAKSYRNPDYAAILGFIIPGLGHVYLGNLKMALFFFIIGAIGYSGGYWGLPVALISAWAAYDEAKKSNAAIAHISE